MSGLDFKEIRKLIVIAMFTDDVLMDQFVLKGGNALDIVYQRDSRFSIDIDLSMREDFVDIEDAKQRIFRSLKDRFDSYGYVVFDESFQQKPAQKRSGQSARWGGYRVEFKVIDKERFRDLEGDLTKLQKSSLAIGPSQKRTFSIDISKYEYCDTKEEHEVDDYTVYVYTLPMIALEKLRAICQQMDEYPQTKGTPRARDFYDIYELMTEGEFDILSQESKRLIIPIFEAKEVPISLLAKIPETREFHRPDWDSVVQSVTGTPQDFDFYFDEVAAVAQKLLHALGVE